MLFNLLWGKMLFWHWAQHAGRHAGSQSIKGTWEPSTILLNNIIEDILQYNGCLLLACGPPLTLSTPGLWRKLVWLIPQEPCAPMITPCYSVAGRQWYWQGLWPLFLVATSEQFWCYKKQWKQREMLTVSQTSCPAGSQLQTSLSSPSGCGRWDSGSPRRWAQPRWGSCPSSSFACARQSRGRQEFGKVNIENKGLTQYGDERVPDSVSRLIM